MTMEATKTVDHSEAMRLLADEADRLESEIALAKAMEKVMELRATLKRTREMATKQLDVNDPRCCELAKATGFGAELRKKRG
jgi:hypothetical protein